MRATVEGAGVELAYEQLGHGEAVVLVHDMAPDRGAETALAERLSARARVTRYDRRGYGASGAPEPYEGTTVYEQSEDAAALIAALELAPAIVCGAGFGALIALDLAIRHAALVRALVCAEPPLYAFVPAATEVLATEHELLREAVTEEGPAAAVGRWLQARRGQVPSEGARAAADAGAFFADFAGLSSWPVTRAQLRAVSVAMVVVTGPPTPPYLDAAADALARLGPRAQRVHDGDLARALEDLLA
jgi:3-oxoadipate enol-lactonase